MPNFQDSGGLRRAQRELLASHNQYIRELNNCLQSQRLRRVPRRISDAFVGYFAHANFRAPEVLDAIGYRESLKKVVRQFGSEASFEVASRHVSMRGPREGIVVCRYRLRQAEHVLQEWAMEVWRKEEGAWKLVRVYEETL